MKLGELTKQILAENKENDWFNNRIVEQLYLLCYKFIRKYPIYIDYIDKEDYVNELITYIWGKIDKFDETRASFTTFAWLCCLTWYSNTTKVHYNHTKYGKKFSIDGYNEKAKKKNLPNFVFVDKSESNLKKLIKKDEFKRRLKLCREPLKMYINGDSVRTISYKLGKSTSAIYWHIKKNIKEIKDKV